MAIIIADAGQPLHYNDRERRQLLQHEQHETVYHIEPDGHIAVMCKTCEYKVLISLYPEEV